MPAFRLFPVLAETGIPAGLCNSADDSLRIYREILFLWEMPVGKMNWYASFAVAVLVYFISVCMKKQTMAADGF